MADFEYASITNAQSVTVSGTKTIQLQPGEVYTVTLGATSGTVTGASLDYDNGGSWTTYPNDPGTTAGGLEIKAPPSGLIRVYMTGTNPARNFSFVRSPRR